MYYAKQSRILIYSPSDKYFDLMVKKIKKLNYLWKKMECIAEQRGTLHLQSILFTSIAENDCGASNIWRSLICA